MQNFAWKGKKICLVVVAVFMMVFNVITGGGAAEYTYVSDDEKKEIESIIHDYLLKEETRETLAKARLISPLYTYWDNGLHFKSEDGNFKLQIGGHTMNDWGRFNEDSGIRRSIGDQVDGTEFRSARLYVSGDIYKNIGFKAQYDFAGGGRPDMHMADSFVDTGSFAAKHANLFNPELAVVYGSFSFQSEYTFTNVGTDFPERITTIPIGGIDITRRSDGSDNLDFSGWYVFGSYFITGEHRKYIAKTGTFGHVIPIQNFDMNGGWGAIELTARYAELD